MLEKRTIDGIFSEQEQIKTTTYKEQAYDLIKSAILYQKLKPDAIYSQEALCQELGSSRTPVREALLELQKEGYLRFCRGKGFQVVSLDKEAIHDILEMRICLETTAAELAAKRAAKEDLEQIRLYLDQMLEMPAETNPNDIIECYRLDHQFHRAVARAAHNDLLYRTLDDALNHYLRFEVLTVYQNGRSAQAIRQEHMDIYKFILAGDSKMAYKAAGDHLQEAYKRTLAQYWDN